MAAQDAAGVCSSSTRPRSWRAGVVDDLIDDLGVSALSAAELDLVEARAAALIAAVRSRRAGVEVEVRAAEGACPMRLLTVDELRLIVDKVDECDALPLALSCRRLRDIALARWPVPNERYSFRWNARIEEHVTSIPRLKWAVTLACPLDARTTRAAAAGGHLEVLQYLRSLSPPCRWGERVCEAAAMGGHMHVLTWLRSTLPPPERCPWDVRTAAAAAKGGYLDMLRWIRVRKAPWDSSCVAAAASAGHLSVLEWARKRNCPWDEEAMYEAEAGGHTHIIEWALDHDLPRDTVEFGSEAAVHGDIVTLNWLHNEPRIDLERQPHTLWLQAAASGKIETLRWLHEHEYSLIRADPEPCVTAADHGFLEALRFLHELGCAWNVGVCNAAAQRGDMAILTYAHEHGCPWSPETCKAAGDPGPYDATIHYDECQRASSLTVLQYLHKEGCPWHPDALLYASREVIAWARANGLPGRLSREDVEVGGYGGPMTAYPLPGGVHHHHYHPHFEDHEMPPAFAHGPPPHHAAGMMMPGPPPGMLPPGMNPMQWLMAGQPPPWG